MNDYKIKMISEGNSFPTNEILEVRFVLNIREDGWNVFLNNNKTNFEVLKLKNDEDEWIEIYHNDCCIETYNNPLSISIDLLRISSTILKQYKQIKNYEI